MQEISEKIIEKVKKLLSLSDSSNEHEAKSAMLMAQRLMAKHNLELKDVVIEDEVDVCEIKAGSYGRRTWRRLLANVISSNFRCSHFYNNKGRSGFIVVFVGLLEDVEIAKKIYEFAIETIEVNQKNLYKELHGIGRMTKGLKKSYAIGFIHGLDDSFEEQVEELKEEFGLVLQTPVVVVDYMGNKEFSGSAPKAKLDIENAFAMKKGYDDGVKFGTNNAEDSASADENLKHDMEIA